MPTSLKCCAQHLWVCLGNTFQAVCYEWLFLFPQTSQAVQHLNLDTCPTSVPFLLSFTHQTVKSAILSSGKCLVAPSLAVHGAQQNLVWQFMWVVLSSVLWPFSSTFSHTLVTLFALPKFDKHLQMSIYMWCLFAFSHGKLHLFFLKRYLSTKPQVIWPFCFLPTLHSPEWGRKEEYQIWPASAVLTLVIAFFLFHGELESFH